MGLKQHGNGFVTGTMGDLVYYRKGGNYYVRKRPANLSKKVRTAPCYANTRRNASEFSTAIQHAKRIRKIIQPKIKGITSNESMNRLHSILIGSVRSGVGNWGERTLNFETLNQTIAGYEFGAQGRFFDMAPYLMNIATPSPITTAACTVTPGQVTSTIPDVPASDLSIAPEFGATDFMIWVAHIYHDGSDWFADIAESNTADIAAGTVTQFSHTTTLPEQGFVMRVIGIRLMLGDEKWNFGRDDAAIVDFTNLLT